MKKVITIIILLVIVVIGINALKPSAPESNQFTIGAILPLSGPAAIWGENVKKGMDLALKDHPEIKVIYQDSEGKPANGVSAFNVLKEKKVNMMLSILSAVTVPVAQAAKEQKIPLFGTLTASDSVVNEYTTRYYSNAQDFAEPAFIIDDSPLKTAKNIAVLYRNDELGTNVLKKIEALSKQYGKDIVLTETFKPGETDFNTALLKVKNVKADVLLFVPVTPGEAVGIVKTARQLGITIPLIEESNVFADPNNRKELAGITFYTNSYNFSNEGTSEEFKTKYRNMHGSEANFAGAFGYDTLQMIARCIDQKDQITSCLRSIETFDGVTGKAKQIAPGDFNMPMKFEKVN
jgi:branched-chain amino acid transport system substrate-binding protein